MRNSWLEGVRERRMKREDAAEAAHYEALAFRVRHDYDRAEYLKRKGERPAPVPMRPRMALAVCGIVFAMGLAQAGRD